MRHSAFALLWSATLLSNTGTWMHEVGAGWLMTELDPSPATVALVQAANMAPIFCFALLAGALADRYDKRRILLLANLILLGLISAMALVVAADHMSANLLIAFTFAIGALVSLAAPAWQAVVPALVPKTSLSAALALNSMGVNISRAIGPALAGLLIAQVGMAAPFFLNALSCGIAAAAVYRWRPKPQPRSALAPEPLLLSILTGLRHAARNGPLKATLLRGAAFFICASAFWSLLPLVARSLPGGDSRFYGLLLGTVGAGAVATALVLPAARRAVGSDRLAQLASALMAVAMLVIAFVPDRIALMAAALGAGGAWIASMVGFSLSAQASLPDWVRARGLALFLMVFAGAMTLGSVIWGRVAAGGSLSMAMVLSAAALLLPLPWLRRVPLGQAEGLDLSPAMAWEKPAVAPSLALAADRGPVMVTIDFQIQPEDQQAFVTAMADVANARYRTGASHWGLQQDAAHPEYWQEWFLLPNWGEHLRQHERTTISEQTQRQAAWRFHRGASTPRVRHLLGPASGLAGD